MQENYPQNPGSNENITAQPVLNQKSTSPILYILTGFGVAVVAFGLGYMVRGYSINEYMAEEIMVQEEAVMPIPMMEDEPAEINLPSTIVENEEYVYTNKELGFSLTLPEKYAVLSQKIAYSDSEIDSLEFYLPVHSINPINNGISEQMVFSIQRLRNLPGESIYADSMGKLIKEDSSNKYVYFPTLDVGIMPEQPEFDIFMSLVDQDLFPIVKNGFKIL